MRVDDRASLRQFGAAFMVVGDDRVNSDGACVRDLLNRRNARIYRDHQGNALFPQGVDRGFGKPVPLFTAARNVVADVRAVLGKIEEQKRIRRHAVRVIIAVNGDAFSPLNGKGKPLDRQAHIPKQKRIVRLGFLQMEETVCRFHGTIAAQIQKFCRNGRDPQSGRQFRNRSGGFGIALIEEQMPFFDVLIENALHGSSPFVSHSGSD